MKMVKSVYKKILENVPTHMPETGGMLGGQDGTVTKVVFDGGKDDDFRRCHYTPNVATVYKGNIIKNLIMDCQSYTKYRPNETTGGIFVSWRRKEELPTGA